MPTQIGSRQLRSSSAHCARKLAEEIGDELARRKWTWKVDADMVEEKLEEEEEEEGGRTALIKSNNPHLAGGEKLKCSPASGAKDKLQHAARLVRPHLLGFPASHGAGEIGFVHHDAKTAVGFTFGFSA